MDYLAQRGGRVKELEQQLAELIETNKRTQLKLQIAEETIDNLKADGKTAAAHEEARLSQAQREKQELEQALQREISATSALVAARQKAEDLQREAEAGARALRAQLEQLQDSASDAKLELTQQVHQAQAQVERLERNCAQAEERIQEAERTRRQAQQQHEKALSEMQRQLEDAITIAEAETSKRREAEAYAAEVEARTVSPAGLSARSSDDATLIKSLRDMIKQQEEEVGEARKIKNHAKNVQVVEEKLRSAEAKVEQAQGQLTDYAQLQAQVAHLQREALRWQSVLTDVADVESPEDVLHRLNQLGRDQATATQQLGDKEAEVRALKESLHMSVQQRQEGEAALKASQDACAELAATAARLERKVTLLTRERDGLKKIIESYDEEDGSELAAHAPAGTPQRAAQAARIDQLNQTVLALEGQVRELEAELQATTAAQQQQAQVAARAKADAESYASQAKRLEQECDDLGRQVGLLQEKLGRGEYNKATTKVLHYVHNPEAEAQKEVEQARQDALQAENAALKAHLQRLEAQVKGGTAEGSSGSEAGMSAALAEAEIAVLNRKVSQLEKSGMRLKEVFQKHIANFREACYYLFGYRIDMASEATPAAAGTGAVPTTFQLKPQHADDKRALLLFRFKDGNMELLPNEYTTRKLQKEVETFIVRYKSIPALTANLTMDMFQKQTQC
ncbi:hypothetical protein WJX72_005559 [[Myrmecia] bisecta]|uniref:Mitotic spindle assembly checkpoint protein MAD1 n=1 Tax=[Myrmecia] bisecta TaxID=41462 RepID=A0AAW1QFQ1_9CHLO